MYLHDSAFCWSLYSDTNECERYSDICGPQQSCLNNIGGHSCVCVMGYEVDPSDPYRRTCQGKYVLALLSKHFPSSATCHRGLPVKCQMLASQTLMNAAMQLFSVCHYALELRVDVLTGLGHTSVPALLALSWPPLLVLMELLRPSVKVSHECQTRILVWTCVCT